MKAELLIKVARGTAVGSFLLATSLMIAFYVTNSFVVAIIGDLCSLIAFAVNSILLIALLVYALRNKEDRKRTFLTTGLLLANIPVVLVYSWFVVVLLNTMRITFVNKTGKPLTEIKITGCEPATINELAPGERTTSWIKITGDCSISIEYQLDGKLKREVVFGYVTNTNGHKGTYRIGEDKAPIDDSY